MKIIKYTFDVPVVAMVSHIPVKSRMAVNYVTFSSVRDEKPFETIFHHKVTLLLLLLQSSCSKSYVRARLQVWQCYPPTDNMPIYSFILNNIIFSLKAMLNSKFMLGH